VRRSSVAARRNGHLLRHVDMYVSGAPTPLIECFRCAAAHGARSAPRRTALPIQVTERKKCKEDEVPKIGAEQSPAEIGMD
jgi:hypothetical protein